MNNSILLGNIPSVSERIMTDLNLRIYNKSLEKNGELYVSDSLLTKYSPAQIINRSKREEMAFISTNPNDPTEGRDTVYTQGILVDDTSLTQGVFFALKMKDLHMDISAVSSIFHPVISRTKTNVLVPFGFMKYDKVP